MINTIIESKFNSTSKGIFKKQSEVRQFILGHEKKHLCVENLAKEIKIMELKGKEFSKRTIELLSEDFARLFAQSALQLKEEQLLSEAKKIQKQKNKQDREDYQKMLESDGDALVEDYK